MPSKDEKWGQLKLTVMGAVIVAQLLPTPDIRSSNPAIGYFYSLYTVF